MARKATQRKTIAKKSPAKKAPAKMPARAEKKPPKSLGTIAAHGLAHPDSLTNKEVQKLAGRVEADRKYGAKRSPKATGLKGAVKAVKKAAAAKKTVKPTPKRTAKK